MRHRRHTTALPGGVADIPLLIDMDDATFAKATVALLKTGNDIRLRRFLRTTSNIDACTTALDKWVIFSAEALDFERPDLADSAIEALHDADQQGGASPDAIRKRLPLVIRIYTISSLAVRLGVWETVHSLALRPVPASICNNYMFSSWIRHAQVDASRARLTQDDRRGGFLISAARELLVNHSAMRPDVADDEIPPVDQLAADDILLNSLCQFDIAYCLVVAAEGTYHGADYPSSAVLNEDRAIPITQRIVADPGIRRRLFPNSDDARIAEALADVFETTIRESLLPLRPHRREGYFQIMVRSTRRITVAQAFNVYQEPRAASEVAFQNALLRTTVRRHVNYR